MGVKQEAKRLLAIPAAFEKQALAFPDKIDAALALIDDPKKAKELLDKADAMAHYAHRIKADTRIANAILYGKLKIVAKVGELSPATPKNQTGRGNKSASPTEGLFATATIAAYRKVAHNRERIDTYYQHAGESIDSGKESSMSISGFVSYCGADGNLAKSFTGEVEWYTPARFIESARRVMGSIDLDPASNDYAQQTVKADRYFTADTGGLDKSWNGNVFLNPPFKMPLVEQFVGKLCQSYKDKSVTQAILLTNNNSDTGWWHAAAMASASICFTRGRVKFYNRAGESSAPTNGQTFFYFGRRLAAFRKEFGRFGWCI